MSNIRISGKVVLIIVTVWVLVLGGGFIYMLQQYNSSEAQQTRRDNSVVLESYNHVTPGEVTCMAQTPSCGYCPGEIIDKECHVSKEVADQWQ